jgi:uncharacterized protein (DUF1778 family)
MKRGRPRKKVKKDQRLALRVTEDELEALRERAELLGLTLSEYVLRAALEAA